MERVCFCFVRYGVEAFYSSESQRWGHIYDLEYRFLSLLIPTIRAVSLLFSEPRPVDLQISAYHSPFDT